MSGICCKIRGQSEWGYRGYEIGSKLIIVDGIIITVSLKCTIVQGAIVCQLLISSNYQSVVRKLTIAAISGAVPRKGSKAGCCCPPGITLKVAKFKMV